MIDSLSDHYLICGFGRVGRQVVRDLRGRGRDVRRRSTATPRRLRWPRPAGVHFLEGEPSADELLRRPAGHRRAPARSIACVDSDAENVFIDAHRPRARAPTI